jgi:hypothetical protein
MRIADELVRSGRPAVVAEWGLFCQPPLGDTDIESGRTSSALSGVLLAWR